MTRDTAITFLLIFMLACIFTIGHGFNKPIKPVDHSIYYQNQIDSLKFVIDLKNDSLKMATQIIDENMKNSRNLAND